jgi:hypothetical protein
VVTGSLLNRRRLAALTLVALVALVLGWALASSVPAAPACDRTWDGGGGTLAWATATNWSGDVTPQPGENVCIDAVLVVHSTGTDSIGSLQGTGGVSLTGGEIDLTYTGNDASIARFDISAGTLGGTGVLQVSATMAWSGGSMAQAGTTRILSGATLTHGSSTTFMATGRTLDVQGTMDLISTAGISQSTAPAALIQVGATGALRKTTAVGNATINVVVDNDGSVESSAGTLFLSGGTGTGTSTGDYTGSGGTVSLNGVTHVLGDGVTLSGTAIAGAIVSVANGATVTASGSNTFSSGTVNGTGTFDVTGTLAWSGGSMAEAGQTTIAPAGAITHGSSTTFLATGRTLDVQGTLELISTAGISQSTAPAALIQVESTGTLLKSTAVGNATINVVVDNDGSVQSSAGTLFLSGGTGAGTSTGDYSGTGGATVSLSGGTHTLGDGVTLTGTAIAGATVTVPNGATVTAAGTNAFSAGIVNGTGTFSVTGTLAWSGGSMTEAGHTTIAPAGAITHGSSTTFLATGRTLDVQGMLELISTAGISQSTAPAGLIQVAATGTLRKSTAVGNATINVVVDNDGSVESTAGTLFLSGGTGAGTSTGDYSGTGGGTVSFNGGTDTLGDGVTLTGSAIAGSTVTIPNGATVTASGSNAFSSGTVNGTGTFDVTGTLAWSGGSMAEAGQTTIAPAATITHGPSTTFLATGRTLDVQGTLELTAAAGISQSTAPAGLIHVEAGGTVLKSTAVGNATINVALRNDGTVTATAGKLNLGAASASPHTGTFDGVDASAHVAFSAGTHVLGPGAQLTGFTEISGATVEIPDATTISVPGTLLLSGGTLGGAGTLDVPGVLQWTGGDQAGPGATTIGGAGEVQVSGCSATLLDGRQVTNAGTIRLLGGATVDAFGQPASAVENSGLLEIDDTTPGGCSNGWFGDALIHNTGSVTKIGGATSAALGVLENDGTVTVSAGDLQITGATGTGQSGTFTASGAGTTITFADGTTSLVPPGSISGSASVVCCARLEMAPGMTMTVAPADTLTLDGGTIGGGGTIAIAGTLSWPDGDQADGGTTIVKAGGTATIGSASGSVSLGEDRSFVNEGHTVVSDATLDLNPGASIQNAGTFDLEGAALLGGSYIFGYGLSSLMHNAGLLRKADAGAAQTTVPIDNDGTIEVSAGSLALRSLLNYSTSSLTLTGGTFAARGAKLALPGELDVNAARLIVDGPGAQLVAQEFEGSPETDALAALRRNAGAGVIELAGARSQPLTGPFHNAGALRIGAGSALTIAGDFIAEPDSSVRPRIAGATANTTGTLTVSGAATLDGTLALDHDPAFHPADGTEIPLIAFASRNGTFAQVTGTDLGGGLSYSPLYGAGDVKVHVGPTGAPPPPASAELPTGASSDQTQDTRPAGISEPATRRWIVDDRSFRIARGPWTRQALERDRGGSFMVSHTRGATLVSPRVRGRRLQLIVHTCPTCGAVAVVWGGRRVGVVSLRSRRSRRAVLPVFARTKPRAGKVRLRATSARRVAIDALIVS